MVTTSPELRDVSDVEMNYQRLDPPKGAGILNYRGVAKEEFQRSRKLMTDPRSVTLLDARTASPGGSERSWNLDTHGFALVRAAEGNPDFRDKRTLREEYYPKVAELAKALTNAERGFVLTHALRSENPKNAGIAYSRLVHADAGPLSVPMWRACLAGRFGVPEEEAKSCEICFVGVWQPIDRPAYRDPLCLLDFSSFGAPYTGGTERYLPGDLVVKVPYADHPESERLQRITVESNYGKAAVPAFDAQEGVKVFGLVGPAYAPKHRWVFCSDMRPDECWVFKHYDTRNGVAKSAFHDSFHDPFHASKPKESHGRRSVEFRVLLTFPPGGGKTKTSSGSAVPGDREHKKVREVLAPDAPSSKL